MASLSASRAARQSLATWAWLALSLTLSLSYLLNSATLSKQILSSTLYKDTFVLESLFFFA
jgi:hypothetical protein